MIAGKSPWTCCLALACAVLLAVPADAAKPTPRRDKGLEAQLLAHIRELADDSYQGREPGTDGEARTLRYLARQWFEMGLVSGTNNPGSEWFAPVTLVARQSAFSNAEFTRKGRRVYASASDILVLTSGKRSLVRDAPVLFVGLAKGDLPPRSELAGRVALLLDGASGNSDRQNALIAAGASAVLTVLDGDRTLENVAARRQRSGYALASDTIGGDLEGFITREATNGLLRGANSTVAQLEDEAAKPGFVPRALDLNATLEATTDETTIRTHNLIGKLPGKRPEAGAVLFVSHWDHFGLCAEPPAEDLVCNGAIDNASGLAAMTEIARRMVDEGEQDRDVYFLATTAEELGLLGAHAFAENPPIPIKQFVAAFNMDSVALAPPGTPFAIVGRGMTKLDDVIATVARNEKRKLVMTDAANAYVRRQDGWALLQHDIPAVLVSTAYGELSRIERFFEGAYHRPNDDLTKPLELGGAADDVKFLTALGMWFSSLKRFPAAAK